MWKTPLAGISEEPEGSFASGRGPQGVGFPTPETPGMASVGRGRGRGITRTSTPVPGKTVADRLSAMNLQQQLGDLRTELERYKLDIEMARREHQGILEEAERDARLIAQDQAERARQVQELEECREKLTEDVQRARQELADTKGTVKDLLTRRSQIPSVSTPGADISKIPFPGLPSEFDTPALDLSGIFKPSGKKSSRGQTPAEPPKLPREHTPRATAARVSALQPALFDGKTPWSKYLKRFEEDMEHNGWGPVEKLHSLKRVLRDGPGEEALEIFEQIGEGTYEDLVHIATRVCSAITRDLPAIRYRTRVQKKGEDLRVYAMDLRRLAMDTYTGVSPDTEWLLDEVNGKFVDGIRDSELQAVIRTAWQPRMTLQALCEIGEYHLRKKLYSRTIDTSFVAAVVEDLQVPEAPSKGKEKKEEPAKTASPPMGMTDAEVEALIKRILGEKGKAKKPKLPKEQMQCYRCQEKGHVARECIAPTPVPRNQKGSKGKEN